MKTETISQWQDPSWSPEHPAFTTFKELASGWLLVAVREALAEGTVRWKRDPMNSSTFGLFRGDTCLVIVYTDLGDFEVSDDILEVLA